MMPMDPNRHPTEDRRSGRDRRRADQGPPGTADRRRGVEPRQPEVMEIEMSPSQWMTLTGDAAAN
jgi:hypothetical protein